MCKLLGRKGIQRYPNKAHQRHCPMTADDLQVPYPQGQAKSFPHVSLLAAALTLNLPLTAYFSILIPVFTVNLQDHFPTSRPWTFQYQFLFSVPTVLLPHTRSHKPHSKCTSTLQGSFSPSATHVNHPPALRLSPGHFMNLKLSIQSVFPGYWF